MLLENTPITRLILLISFLSASFFNATGSSCAALLLAASSPARRDAAVATCAPSWMVGADDDVMRGGRADVERHGTSPAASSSSLFFSLFVTVWYSSFWRTSFTILPFLSFPFGPLAMNFLDGLIYFGMLIKLRELEKRWGSGRFLSFVLTMAFSGSIYAQTVLLSVSPFSATGLPRRGDWAPSSSFLFSSSSATTLNDLLHIFSCLGSLVPLSALVMRYHEDMQRIRGRNPILLAVNFGRAEGENGERGGGRGGTSTRVQDRSRESPSSVLLWIGLVKLVFFSGGAAVLANGKSGTAVVDGAGVWRRLGAVLLGAVLGTLSSPPNTHSFSSLASSEGSTEGEDAARQNPNYFRLRREKLRSKGTLVYRWILFFSVYFCKPLCRTLDPLFSIFNRHRNAHGVSAVHHLPKKLRQKERERLLAEQHRFSPRNGRRGDDADGVGGSQQSAVYHSEVHAPGTQVDRVGVDEYSYRRDRQSRGIF